VQDQCLNSTDMLRIQTHLLDSLDNAVHAHTLDGKLVYANRAFLEQTGLAEDAFRRVGPFGWLSPEQRGRQAQVRARLAITGETVFDAIIDTPDGPRFAVVQARLIDLADEPIVLAVVHATTVAEQDHWQDLEFKSLLLDVANDAVIVHTFEGEILYGNETACVERGYTREEFLQLRFPDYVAESRRAKIERVNETIRREGTAVFESENRRKDGTLFPVEVRAKLVDFDGREIVVSVVRDITERKRAEQDAARLAFHDALTGLPNRRLFVDRLDRAVAHLSRSHETLALLFIDIDDLKTVNDSLGHAAGDEVLLEVASRLSGLLRMDDTVARLGGDEFTVLLPSTDEAGARDTADRILEAFQRPFTVRDQHTFVSASCGVVIADEQSADPETLLRQADLAMYNVKTTSRNGYIVFEPHMAADALEKFNLTNDLHAAMQADELALNYQPQLRLSDGRIAGAEALLRWPSPTRGHVSPLEFIPVAEETGMIIPLGEWVLRRACADHALWRERGFELRVAVNISPRQIQHGDLVEIVAGALDAVDMNPAFLELEVTESVALSRSAFVQKTLNQLANLGVRIAIDDFGTGYSSLSHLQALPVHTLKVDRSFIASIRTPRGQQIARAVLALGQGLNLTVVAEGVETEDQLAFLAQHNCDQYQGFLFSRPVDCDRLFELLNAERG